MSLLWINDPSFLLLKSRIVSIDSSNKIFNNKDILLVIIKSLEYQDFVAFLQINKTTFGLIKKFPQIEIKLLKIKLSTSEEQMKKMRSKNESEDLEIKKNMNIVPFHNSNLNFREKKCLLPEQISLLISYFKKFDEVIFNEDKKELKKQMPKQIMNVPNLKMVPPPAPNSVQEQQKVPTLREINEEFEFLYFNRQEEQTLLEKMANYWRGKAESISIFNEIILEDVIDPILNKADEIGETIAYQIDRISFPLKFYFYLNSLSRKD